MGGSFKEFVRASGDNERLESKDTSSEEKIEEETGIVTLRNALRKNQSHIFQELVSRKRELNVIVQLWKR